MKRIALIVALGFAPAAHAQDAAPAEEGSEGWNMLREGSKLLMQELFDELEPTLKDLEGFVDDLNAYEPPVILPNGDILIRRKPDMPAEPHAIPDEPPAEGEGAIDL